MNVILNIHYVILNVVKNLLSGNTLSTLSLVGFEEIATSGKALLAMTIILSSLSLVGFEEILRVAQDDRGLRGDPSRCSG